MTLVFLLCLLYPFSGYSDELPTGVLWEQDRVIAMGQGVVPDSSKGTAGGQLLAKRAAMVDLQRNLLEFVQGVRIQSTTTMVDFMVHDRVVSSVQGAIKGVQILSSNWDGEIYSLWGAIPMKAVRGAVVQEIPGFTPKKTVPYEGKGFDSLVIDLDAQPFDPSMVISVRSASGKEVYGVSYVDRDSFVQEGMFKYKRDQDDSSMLSGLFGASPAWATSDKALILKEGVFLDPDGAIVVPDRAATLIEENGFDFRVPCKVTVIAKTAAVRGKKEAFICYLKVPVDL
nr:hypothetical protein [uncultured Dethiosulfovibrio sp.]